MKHALALSHLGKDDWCLVLQAARKGLRYKTIAKSSVSE